MSSSSPFLFSLIHGIKNVICSSYFHFFILFAACPLFRFFFFQRSAETFSQIVSLFFAVFGWEDSIKLMVIESIVIIRANVYAVFQICSNRYRICTDILMCRVITSDKAFSLKTYRLRAYPTSQLDDPAKRHCIRSEASVHKREKYRRMFSEF